MKTLLGFLIIIAAFALPAEDTNHPSGHSRLAELASAKGSPIVYDKQVGEYQLVWTNHQQITLQGTLQDAEVVLIVPLEFDPFTGKKLESRRDELFTTPSRAESKEVFQKLESCKKIEDVIRQFGKPDQVWPKNEFHRDSQYEFQRGFKTLTLVVSVDEDGSLTAHVLGKQIKNSVNE